MGTTWIYRPRSGDRVRAIIGSAHLGWVEYPNGCRHVVGDLGHLVYEAAQPGRWWRDTATTAACEIVSAIRGGAAWDEQGRVHLLVPHEHAAGADRVMRDVRPHEDAAEDHRNAGALFSAGAAEVVLEQGRLMLRPKASTSPAGDVTSADAPPAPWEGTWHGGAPAPEPTAAAVEAA